MKITSHIILILILIHWNNMSLSKTQKILLGVVLVLGLGGAGYYFYSGGSPTTIPVVDIISSGNSQAVGEDILIIVSKLDSISIESSVFSGALFNSLRDYASTLTTEPQGRSNPFAPLGVEGSSQAAAVGIKPAR